MESGRYGQLPASSVGHYPRVAWNSALPALPLSTEFLRHADDRGKNRVTIARRSLKQLLDPRTPYERNMLLIIHSERSMAPTRLQCIPAAFPSPWSAAAAAASLQRCAVKQSIEQYQSLVISAIVLVLHKYCNFIQNKKYVLWNVYLPNALHSVCLNRLSCTEVGIYNGANSPDGFLTTAVAELYTSGAQCLLFLIVWLTVFEGFQNLKK